MFGGGVGLEDRHGDYFGAKNTRLAMTFLRDCPKVQVHPVVVWEMGKGCLRDGGPGGTMDHRVGQIEPTRDAWLAQQTGDDG